MLESILRKEIHELKELVKANHGEGRVLEEILQELIRIRRQLEPKFTLHIEYWGYFTPTIQIRRREPMAAIIAGQSNSFFLAATASDNSTVTLASPTLIADDTNVAIVPDASDPSGLTFTVTVPASDTQTSFNLNATAQASSNTSATAQQVTATLSVTISPAAAPVTFTLTINEK